MNSIIYINYLEMKQKVNPPKCLSLSILPLCASFQPNFPLHCHLSTCPPDALRLFHLSQLSPLSTDSFLPCSNPTAHLFILIALQYITSIHSNSFPARLSMLLYIPWPCQPLKPAVCENMYSYITRNVTARGEEQGVANSGASARTLTK